MAQLTQEDLAHLAAARDKQQGALNQAEKDALAKAMPHLQAMRQQQGGQNAPAQNQQPAQAAGAAPKVLEFKPQYDGVDGAACDTFVRHFRAWAQAGGASNDQKFYVLTQALVGAADAWLRWAMVSDAELAGAVQAKNSDALVSALQARFGNYGDDVTAESLLRAAQQRPGESIASFASRLESIAAGAKTPISLNRLLITLQSGLLRSELRTHALAIVTGGACKSLTEAVRALARIEASLGGGGGGPGQRPVAAVAEVESESVAPSAKPDATQQVDLAALVAAVAKAVAGSPRKQATNRGIKGDCWTCGKKGHRAANCRSQPQQQQQQQQKQQQQPQGNGKATQQ